METTPPETNPPEATPPEANPPDEMTHQPPAPPLVDGDVSELDFTQETKWPKVLGIISLIYAIGGLLCQVGVGISTAATDLLMSLGGITMEVPPLVRWPGLVMAIFAFCLGILMLLGAIGLLRRRRSGVSKLRKWAVMRLILLLIGLGVTVATLPAQVQFQMAMVEVQNQRLVEGGRADLVQPVDEQKIANRIIRIGLPLSLVGAVYPLFLGLYLSRKKITEEVAGWDEYSEVL